MMKLLKFLMTAICILMTGLSFAEDTVKKGNVIILDIKSEIDPRVTRYLELGLEEAKRSDVDAVLIHMDTYGGLVLDANKIVDMFLKFEKPIYVFIDKNAASAGALISIACDSIFMTTGATIGAATVVNQEGAAAPDKYQSYMRAIMRSTAVANGRNPAIAEAMVDQDVAVDSIIEAGKVLTFTTEEAIQHGFCEGHYESIQDVLEHLELKLTKQGTYRLSNTEKVIGIFLSPWLKGILVLVILGGLYFELQTPGIGFPIVASLVAVILYFVPDYLHGMLANWEILLFFGGVILLVLEVFVIPGFGIAGIGGIILVLSALILSMVPNDNFDFTFVDPAQLTRAITVASVAVFGMMFLVIFGGAALVKTKRFQRLTLQSEMDGTAVVTHQTIIGETGQAYTVLRPSGKVMVQSKVYDAHTRGDFIEKGTSIKVIGEEGGVLIVKIQA